MKIAILDDYQDAARRFADWGRLPASCELTVFTDHVKDRGALLERLKPFDIVCVMRERTPLPGDLIAELPNLKLIVTTGGRNFSIDVAAAHARGITVCGTPSLANGTAELTMGLVIGLKRGIFSAHRSLHEHGWQTGVGGDVKGATLGILGLGRLGSEVARMAQAMGMDVMAWSFNMTGERAAEAGVTAGSLEEVLARSDVATVHLRLSDDTRGLIGRDRLARMKPSAFLINTSRGPIVDTDALIEAVEAGRLAGAALDVYDEEPLPAGHRLRQVPGIYLTPHVGFVTENNYRVFYEGTLEAIEAFLAGAPVRVIE